MNQDPHTSSPAFVILSLHDIAIRAYQLYLERGRVDGFADDDWLRAEQELKARGEDAERRRDS
jgi:Tfp pilus assembly major pilin PilA